MPDRLKPVLAFANAVRFRLKEVRGAHLVATLVLRIFLSLIPILLTAIGVLGFIAAHRKGGDDLGKQVIKNLKLSGDLAKLVNENLASAKSSRKASSIIGLVSLAFSGSAVFGAVAEICDTVWQVPVRGLKDRALGVVWFIGAVVAIAGSALATAAVKFIPVPGLSLIVGIVGTSATGAVLFWWTQVLLTNARVPKRAFLPGAVVGGIALAAFQLFGTFVVGRLLAQAGALYASLAAVIALLTFLSIFGWLIVLSVTVNVVRWEAQHGTVTLMIQAPALPTSAWVQAERGGQRPKIKKPVKLPAFVSRRSSRPS